MTIPVPWSMQKRGPMVAPGRYTVTLSKRVDGVETVLSGPQSFAAVARSTPASFGPPGVGKTSIADMVADVRTATPSHAAQTLWPDHCVQGTNGADFHPGLELDRFRLILRKGATKG